MKRKLFSRFVLIICVSLVFGLFAGAKKVKKESAPLIEESILVQGECGKRPTMV